MTQVMKHLKIYQKIVLTLCLLFSYSYSYSQISEGGTPPSFKYKSELKSIEAPLSVPVNFSVEDMKKADEWQYRNGISPIKIAHCIPASYSLMKDGVHTTLPGGERITTLNLEAKDAIALIVSYQEFYIPEGGKLFIYNADKTHILGAYTDTTNPSGDIFSTELIAGDQVIFEYVHSDRNSEEPRISISDIGYGYNNLTVRKTTGSDTSGYCMVDINCSEGDDWQVEKQGVVHLNQKVGDFWLICSGSLVNNTAEDFTPYILTAYHCSSFQGSNASSSDYKLWQFFFNYEKPGCKGDGQTIPKRQSMVGCTKIAETSISGGSDGLLLKLSRDIPEDYNPYFNGWDKSNTSAQNGVSIHHPNGDYKKISTYTTPAQNGTFYDGTDRGKTNAFWNIIFRETANGHSVTEGGSSGSPMFNQNHLITGTLTGGSSSCSKPLDSNLYGKLYYHWDVMGEFLDPVGKGQATTLNGRALKASHPAPKNLTANLEQNRLSINWEKPSDANPTSYTISINEKSNTTTETSYSTLLEEGGMHSISVKAVYSDGESQVVRTSVYYAELIGVENLKLETTDKEGVILSWEEPEYTQEIYWGDNSFSGSGLKFNDETKTVYYAQSWSQQELGLIIGRTVKAVSFYGLEGHSYEVFVQQGDKKQTEIVSTNGSNDFKEQELKTPFTITDNGDLLIGIKISGVAKNRVHVITDNSPVESGKGDLVSFDGKEWYSLYDINNDLNRNILISGIISSRTNSTKSMSNMDNSCFILSKTPPSSNITSLEKVAHAASIETQTTKTTNSSLPAAFPEILGYKVYRNDTELAQVAPSTTTYTDKNAPAGTYNYAITVQYPGFESKPVSNDVTVSSIDVANSYPTINPLVFTDQISIVNNEQIKRMDIFSIDGRLVQSVQSPGNSLSTSSFKTGIYIFQLQTQEGKLITLKGMKR